jgi:pyruvate formate lyase activating enzyme
MQAYYDEELILSNHGEDFYQINFYGNNFDCIFYNKTFNEFFIEKQNELQELKNEIILHNVSGIMIAGGEPLLQRQALINIFTFCRKKKIKTAITTNATKPKVLESLIKANLLDLIVINLITNKINFKRITKAGTFFEPSEQVYQNILQSLKILKKYDQELEIVITTDIVPGYVFRKENLLEIATLIKDLRCTWTLRKLNSQANPLLKNINPATNNFIQKLKEIIIQKYPKIIIQVD